MEKEILYDSDPLELLREFLCSPASAVFSYSYGYLKRK